MTPYDAPHTTDDRSRGMLRSILDSAVGSQLARHSALNCIALVVATLLQFAMLTAVSRSVDASRAGVFFEAFATFRLLMVVATLGLDETIVRFVTVALANGASS